MMLITVIPKTIHEYDLLYYHMAKKYDFLYENIERESYGLEINTIVKRKVDYLIPPLKKRLN